MLSRESLSMNHFSINHIEMQNVAVNTLGIPRRTDGGPYARLFRDFRYDDREHLGTIPVDDEKAFRARLAWMFNQANNPSVVFDENDTPMDRWLRCNPT